MQRINFVIRNHWSGNCCVDFARRADARLCAGAMFQICEAHTCSSSTVDAVQDCGNQILDLWNTQCCCYSRHVTWHNARLYCISLLEPLKSKLTLTFLSQSLLKSNILNYWKKSPTLVSFWLEQSSKFRALLCFVLNYKRTAFYELLCTTCTHTNFHLLTVFTLPCKHAMYLVAPFSDKQHLPSLLSIQVEIPPYCFDS